MPEPVIELVNLHIDDRGSVWCPLDNIGPAKLGIPAAEYKDVKRTYVVHNWEKGRIRAWHGHLTGWTGMHVIHGAAKIIARSIRDGHQIAAVFSDRNPGVMWVPPGYFNGAMSLEDNTKILCYSTLTFDEVKEDNVRAELTEKDVALFRVKDR